MTRIVAGLEELALVDRAADPRDRRVAHVTLAPLGRRLLERSRTRKDAYLAGRLRQLTLDERKLLADAAGVLEHLLEVPE